MFTAATLAFLGYCIASAYVLVPAALLLLCAALAHVPVRIDADDEPNPLAAQRDDYALRATVSLELYAYWSRLGDHTRATSALVMAHACRERAEMYARVAAMLE